MVKRKASQQSSKDEEARDEQNSEEPEDPPSELKPIGDVIKRTGRGRSERKFYPAFEIEGSRYNLEDSVLVSPEVKSQKPYVAIIKEIKEAKDGSIGVTGQWFYRPEEAEKRGGGIWGSDDTRELFYSFHRDEVPAESVMHKCVVHFIPSHKKTPPRSQHPGFIVRKVYDAAEKKLWNLTDKDYEDSKQKEINLLVQKTQQALGAFQDMETEEGAPGEPEKVDKVEKPPRKALRRKSGPGIPHPAPLVISRPEVETIRVEEGGRVETPTPTPGSMRFEATDGDPNALLRQFGGLIGIRARDRWTEKILDSIRLVYEQKSEGEKAEGEAAATSGEKQEPQFRAEEAVAAICALEKAAYESINDNHKYNLKMRSLDYNLKNGPVLVQRLLAKQLEPLTVVNMTPAELKDGQTAAEKSAPVPEQPQTVQMADVRCGSCGEPQAGVKDIINAPHGDRYQLECPKCGNNWYSARDFIPNLRIETVNPSPTTVGSAPWKSEEFQKQKELEMEMEKELEKEPEKNEAEKDEEPEKVEQADAPEEAPAEETDEPNTAPKPEAEAETQGDEPDSAPKPAGEAMEIDEPKPEAAQLSDPPAEQDDGGVS